MKKIMALIIASLCGGCVGTFVPVKTAESVGADSVRAGANMPTLDAQQATSMKSIGEVKGYSCKNKVWDPDATTEAATLQTKIAAAQIGATAVTALSCAAGGTSLVTNCWSSITCTATALQ